MKKIITLGIESSCDETAVALVRYPNDILASQISSQEKIHAAFGGVVPEIASRRHMEMMVSLFNSALKEAGIEMDDVDVVAATRAPGLIGALLVGLSFAKSIAYAYDKPFIGVNHLEGHLNAVHLEHDDVAYPHIGLVVSGGHTSLYLIKKFGHYELLGATRDDAAGEAYDKVAKLLGLGYPGGPIIDKLAKTGNPKAFRFTRPRLGKSEAFGIGELDFSFSGLKTAVMQEFKKIANSDGTLSDQIKADMAASFQATVVDILTKQVLLACKEHACKTAIISGGVAANSALREHLSLACKNEGITVHLPAMKFCTDNAAMIAYVGGVRFMNGQRDTFDLAAKANEDICI